MEELEKLAIELEGIKYVPLTDVEAFLSTYYESKLKEVDNMFSTALSELKTTLTDLNKAI